MYSKGHRPLLRHCRRVSYRTDRDRLFILLHSVSIVVEQKLDSGEI
jgi:hypothetical protein